MSPTPPWVNDVTTPHFNRAPDATKLLCNIHVRVQVAKSKFSENCWCWLPNPGLKKVILLLWAMHWTFDLKCSSLGMSGLHQSKPSNFTCLSNLDEASGNLNCLRTPLEQNTSFTLIQTRTLHKYEKKFWPNVCKL